MNTNWDSELEKEVENFVNSASKEEVSALLEKANVDFYNKVGASLEGVCGDSAEEYLLGTAPVVDAMRDAATAEAAPVAVEMSAPKSIMMGEIWNSLLSTLHSKAPFAGSGASGGTAGKTEEMPLAA